MTRLGVCISGHHTHQPTCTGCQIMVWSRVWALMYPYSSRAARYRHYDRVNITV